MAGAVMYPSEASGTWRRGWDSNPTAFRPSPDRIGTTRQTIAAIEHNKYSPSLEAAFSIAEVFGVAIGKVFQWKAGWPNDKK